MSARPRRTLALALILALSGVGVASWLFLSPAADESAPFAVAPDFAAPSPTRDDAQRTDDDDWLGTAASSDHARAELASLLKERLNRAGVRADEALLAFKDAESYRRFLERARTSGLDILGRIDGLHAVRVRVADYGSLAGEIAGNVADYVSVGANPILSSSPPPAEERSARSAFPVGDNLLSVLGLSPDIDTSDWGRGVLVAVLDGGAVADPTFGARLRYLDIGYGLTGAGADGFHGTAVASLVGGASPDARGVAPAADILSIRVTGADGMSDAFSVAQGILAAIDAGAKVVNISLGGYATSPLLGEAIEQALAAGVAVVASSGNDQVSRLAWPAAYEGVVSVGATDAAGIQAIFSNSGDGLLLTAPGYAIQAAGLAGTRTSFSGTSASAPVVSGAIAALLSQFPQLTPLQAADILAEYSNDGGVAGADPDYGRGTLNLGWAMNRNDPSRVDPAISSQSYDAASKLVSVVVQNRGSKSLSGLRLSVDLNGATTTTSLPYLTAGTSTTVRISAASAPRNADGRLVVTSRLILPSGVSDQDLSNNARRGVASLP